MYEFICSLQQLYKAGTIFISNLRTRSRHRHWITCLRTQKIRVQVKVWTQTVWFQCPLCKSSTAEKLLLLDGAEWARWWGAGLSSTYPSFLCLVCPHDYSFLLSLQLFSAFPFIGLFYDFNINDLLGVVIPQTAQLAIKIRLLKPIAKLNRGSKCTLSSKNQN